jgi:anti-sigma B factor antagonist
LLDEPSALQLESAVAAGRAVVALGGEFDLSSKARVDEEIARVVAADPPALVIDLSGLTFIDSSGIHSLVVTLRRCREEGRALYVVPGSPGVQRVLALCGLEQRLTLLDDAQAQPPLARSIDTRSQSAA